MRSDAAAMPVALVEGRAQLTLEARDIGPALVERVEIEWPHVTALPAPNDGPGLRHRRGRLRAAVLVADATRLGRLLAPAGLQPLLADGHVVLSGRAASAAGEVDFTARVTLAPGPGRQLRVKLADVRADGVDSATATAAAAAALSDLSGAPLSDGSFEVDALELALDEIFVTTGWRLPDLADIQLHDVSVSGGTIALSWQSGPAAVAAAAPAIEAVTDAAAPSPSAPAAAPAALAPAPRSEITGLERELDAAAPGAPRAELAQQLAAARERAGDETGAVAALEACLAEAPAGPLVAPAWRRLVELHARRGDPHAAARALIAAADDARTGAAEAERAATLIAAAEILRQRLGLPADAGMLLERAAALDPRSAEALEALEALTTEAGDFERLADVLERKIDVVARGPVEQKHLLARLAEIYEIDLHQPERAERTRARMRQLGADAAGDKDAAPVAAPVPSVEDLELLLASNPGDRSTAEELAGLYGAIDDPAHRAEKLSELLRRALGLSPERRKHLYASVGASAEASGDLDRAEQAYWRAASIEAEPGLRANLLVAHARVVLARGEVQAAITEIEEALTRVPGHAGALVLLADLRYRTQDWTRARELYQTLDGAPGASDAITREFLVHRRAVLAHRADDKPEAEALFRELAILNPQHADARRALAEMAIAQADPATAAQRFEEVLRLVPVDAPADLIDVRHRLGAVYAQLGEWSAARFYLELVASQDGTRAPALELLLEAYDRLNQQGEAAELCARLARLYVDPARRAAALHRRGEILQLKLGDDAGALDAFLRASDLDPGFVPARLRLVHHFWREGDLDVVADLANDLAAAPLSPERDADVIVRLGIATSGPRGPQPRYAPAGDPTLLTAAARALGVAAARNDRRAVDALDAMFTHAKLWAGPDGEAALFTAVLDLAVADPADAGSMCALGGLAARSGRAPLARAACALRAFIAPDGLSGKQVEAAGPPGPVRPEAVRVGGAADHPDFSGPARRALARLAPALLGYGTEEQPPRPTDGSGLPLSRATELRRVADLLAAPPFVLARDAEAAAKRDDRRRLRVIPTQPAGLLIGAAASKIGDRAWAFVAGRALEALRGGLATNGLNGVDGLARLFEGARAALTDASVDEPHARAVADWLRRPEVAIFLGAPETRAEVAADLTAALAALPDWPTFRRGARHTCNRVGLLACGSPVDALGVLADEALQVAGGEHATLGRADFLRGPTALELVKYMLSPAYEAAYT